MRPAGSPGPSVDPAGLGNPDSSAGLAGVLSVQISEASGSVVSCACLGLLRFAILETILWPALDRAGSSGFAG